MRSETVVDSGLAKVPRDETITERSGWRQQAITKERIWKRTLENQCRVHISDGLREDREINEHRLRWQNRDSVNFHLHSRTSRLRRLDIKGNERTVVRVLKRGL